MVEFLKMLENLTGQVNGFLYNYVILSIFFIVAIYFTIKLNGVQFRRLFHAATLLKSNDKKDGIKWLFSFYR